MPNTLFTNANVILDGFAERQGSFDVLVKGNAIHSVSSRPIDHGDATVIDVAGRTLSCQVSSMRTRISRDCH